jgi:hypothetical protein
MKTPFLGLILSSTAWVAQTQHACTMKTNTSTAEKYTPAPPNTRAHSLWCVSSPPVRESLTKRALSSRRHSATKKRKSNPRRPRLPGVQKKRAQGWKQQLSLFLERSRTRCSRLPFLGFFGGVRQRQILLWTRLLAPAFLEQKHLQKPSARALQRARRDGMGPKASLAAGGRCARRTCSAQR